MRERGIFLALLTGLGAITYHSSVSNNATGSQQATTSEALPRQFRSSESELATAFTRFDKNRRFQIGVRADGSCVVDDGKTPDSEDPVAFDWAIALVPDPERSNLRLDFDREIEALQLAARNEGYQFERYWFPWRSEPEVLKDSPLVIRPESNDSDAASGGTVIHSREDNRAKLPGVLLFRNGSSWPLALFLVSESPTAGIASEEFQTAVCLGRHLADLARKVDDGTLRLIGPGFSGSLASLSTLIWTEDPPFTAVTIRTWTMDHGSHNAFRDSLSSPSLILDFKPMEVDLLPAIARFVNYKRKTWGDTTPTILLTEETTAFGYFDPEAQSSEVQTPDKEINDLVAQLKNGNQYIFRVPFPRNLSQLRNATEKQDHLPGFVDDSRRANAPRNGLLLSLRQEAGAALEVPTFSREQTPLSQESVLFTVGDLLKTGVTHYVGIIATDPLDTLFLARYLRSASPNVRIFTTNPDLLFEHGSDSSDYSGIIGISSNPLFPLSQVWDKPRNTIYMFSSEPAEAAYNAAFTILYGVPHSPNRGKQWSVIDDRRNIVNPFTGESEPLWVAVAGRSGFEPITVLV